MCVAGLNVSTQPCAHRWYQLVRPCSAETNLGNCTSKLRLEGWESRIDACPFCELSDDMAHESTHRLIGSNGASLSSMSSMESIRPRAYRSDSETRPSPPNSLTLSLARPPASRNDSFSSNCTVESVSSQRDREMNERLLVYMAGSPHDLLPSARKNCPTYPQLQSQSLTDDTSSDTSSVRARSGNLLGHGWKKGVRISRQLVSSHNSIV